MKCPSRFRVQWIVHRRPMKYHIVALSFLLLSKDWKTVYQINYFLNFHCFNSYYEIAYFSHIQCVRIAHFFINHYF